jgi:hypothetical protein
MSFNFLAFLEPQTLFANIGIALTMIGVYVVYLNSPLNEHIIDGGAFDDEFSSLNTSSKAITIRKNRNMRLGIYLILLGSALQILSNGIDTGPV